MEELTLIYLLGEWKAEDMDISNLYGKQIHAKAERI